MEKLRTNNEKLNDLVLWNQLRAGDEESFSLLFEKYYGALVNYGKTLMSAGDVAKDCVQDVFVDIWTYRYKLNGDVVVKAYLFSSVRKRIARLYEREHIFLRSKSLDSLEFLFDFSIEDRLIDDEATAMKVKHLNRLINTLPPRQKEALYLRYHQGLSVEQISEVLNLNYQSTKNILHRAISQLRKEFPISILALFFVLQ